MLRDEPDPSRQQESRLRLPGLYRQHAIATAEDLLVGGVTENTSNLHEQEWAQVAHAVPKRRLEYAVARRLARRVLADFGVTDFPLLAGPDRAPIWPEGLVGAITHTDGCAGGFCGVAVARRSRVVGIGLDAEPAEDLPADIVSRVLDPMEQAMSMSWSRPGLAARVIFSAKETIYKAVYPSLARFMEFSDVRLHRLDTHGFFAARIIEPAVVPAPFSGELEGRFVMDGELLLTGLAIPARPSERA